MQHPAAAGCGGTKHHQGALTMCYIVGWQIVSSNRPLLSTYPRPMVSRPSLPVFTRLTFLHNPALSPPPLLNQPMSSAHGSRSPSPSAGPPSGLIRPLQGEFTKEQITYLKEMLPAYLAHQSTLSKTATGPRRLGMSREKKATGLRRMCTATPSRSSLLMPPMDQILHR